jgi:hypothetical protein
VGSSPLRASVPDLSARQAASRRPQQQKNKGQREAGQQPPPINRSSARGEKRTELGAMAGRSPKEESSAAVRGTRETLSPSAPRSRIHQ